MSWFKKFLCSWFHIGCPSTTTTTTATLPMTTTTTTPITPITTTTTTPTDTGFIQPLGQSLILNQRPWKMIVDTAWLITERIGTSPNDLSKYLDARRQQGFNTILTSPSGDWFNGTVSKPKEPVFQAFDAVIKAIEDRQMFIIPCIQMHQYVNGKPVCIIPKGEAGLFGQYFANRYGSKKCIVSWMIGGLDDKGVVSNTDIMNQANGVRTVDTKHIMTFHPRANYTTLEAFPIGPNHQMPLYQSYHTYDYATHEQKLNTLRATGTPYANIEGPFDEEGTIGATEVGKVTGIAAKWNVCGFAYGNHYIWQFLNGWQNHLNTAGVKAFLDIALKS